MIHALLGGAVLGVGAMVVAKALEGARKAPTPPPAMGQGAFSGGAPSSGFGGGFGTGAFSSPGGDGGGGFGPGVFASPGAGFPTSPGDGFVSVPPTVQDGFGFIGDGDDLFDNWWWPGWGYGWPGYDRRMRPYVPDRFVCRKRETEDGEEILMCERIPTRPTAWGPSGWGWGF